MILVIDQCKAEGCTGTRSWASTSRNISRRLGVEFASATHACVQSGDANTCVLCEMYVQQYAGRLVIDNHTNAHVLAGLQLFHHHF